MSYSKEDRDSDIKKVMEFKDKLGIANDELVFTDEATLKNHLNKLFIEGWTSDEGLSKKQLYRKITEIIKTKDISTMEVGPMVNPRYAQIYLRIRDLCDGESFRLVNTK